MILRGRPYWPRASYVVNNRNGIYAQSALRASIAATLRRRRGLTAKSSRRQVNLKTDPGGYRSRGWR